MKDTTKVNELSYEEITVNKIQQIKDEKTFIKLVLRWKKLAGGRQVDLKFVLIKNAIYEHFLYKKVRDDIKIWDMPNKYN